jgi:hypothetical protein
VVAYADKHDLKFGEAAVELGLITPSELRQVLVYPFGKEKYVDLRTVPSLEKFTGLISYESCLKYGVLPLGDFRSLGSAFQRVLILGALDPEAADLKALLKSFTAANVAGPTGHSYRAFRVVPILGDAWLERLTKHFSKNPLHADPACSVHRWVELYRKLKWPEGAAVSPESAGPESTAA